MGGPRVAGPVFGLLASVVSVLVAPLPANAQDAPMRLYAAGSLRAALTEAVAAFRAAPGGTAVEATFGASGLLRGRIEGGEAADVFASADLGHPRAVAQARGVPFVLFTRNRLCALVRPGLEVSPDTVLDRMVDPAVKLGTSTPRADPAGDYAWAVFAKAETLRPGTRAALEAKALQLVGGPAPPGGARPGGAETASATRGQMEPPPGETRSVYGRLIGTGAADLFLTYCTNARLAVREVPGATAVDLPAALAVGAEYGLVVLSDRPAAARLALFILSPDGQAALARHGFDAPSLPRDGGR